MNKLTLFMLLFLSTSIFGQTERLSGFNNYSKWVDENNDKKFSAKELQNIDEFVLNDKGNFSFIIILPPPESFWTLKPEKIPSQDFIIEAKDNNTGEEWIVFKSFCRYKKISWFEMKPIKGNITLTCTYLESDIKRTLSYSHHPEYEEVDQHLNYYLSNEQIQTFSELSDEKIKTLKNAKTASLFVIQNFDYFSNYELPFKETANRLLSYAGLNPSDSAKETPDLQIFINVFGNTTWREVRMKDTQNKNYIDVDVVTDVGISGTILFKPTNKDYFANDFKWEKKFDRRELDTYLYRYIQRTSQITDGYNDMFYQSSFLKDFGEMLIDAFNLDPLDFYLAATGDKNNAISYRAIILIGNLHDTSAFYPLLHIYENESLWKQRAAIYALGEVQDPRSTDILIDALNNNDTGLRSRAATALGKLNNMEAVEPLILALDDENQIVVRDVAKALAKLGDKRAVKPLILSIEKVNKYALNTIIQSLGELEDPTAVEYIIPFLKKNRYEEDAQKALIQITGVDMGTDYKNWVKWWNEHKSEYITS